MDEEELTHKHQLMATYKKRRRILELKAAQLGYSADPSIALEIDDISTQISKIELAIGEYEIAPEALATAATRERQVNGRHGFSDKDEQLPPEQRQQQIEKSLTEEGVSTTTAKQKAASTVSDGLKYLFAFGESELDSPAFFTVKLRGGALQIILNQNHPIYQYLGEILDVRDEPSSVDELQRRLSRASDGLKLLLSAWARLEDEQPDGSLRQRTQQTRVEWGHMTRRFLEREE
jgi:hypothetical protein